MGDMVGVSVDSKFADRKYIISNQREHFDENRELVKALEFLAKDAMSLATFVQNPGIELTHANLMMEVERLKLFEYALDKIKKDFRQWMKETLSDAINVDVYKGDVK